MFLRVWAYVLNRSDNSLELVPQRQVAVDIVDDNDDATRTLPPQTPSTVLKRIDDEKTSQQAGVVFATILSGIGAALSSKDTRVTNIGGSISHGHVGGLSVGGSSVHVSETTIHDAQDKFAAQLQQNSLGMGQSLADLEAVYEDMKSGVSSGLLRRNTLYSGTSANGYVFFEFGRVHVESGITAFAPEGRSADALRYAVTLSIDDALPVRVVFIPVPGE